MDNEHSILDVNFVPLENSHEHVKKTRGIIVGLRAHAIVSETKKRILIKMDNNQKLPYTVNASSMFSSEIGSFTCKYAPLEVKKWKEVSNRDKNNIKEALTVSNSYVFFLIIFCLIY